MLKKILKVVLIGGAVCLCLVLAAGFMVWQRVKPRELPVESARDHIQLKAGDKVLHAYTGSRWLDSQRYFVVQADPQTFDARINELSVVPPEPGGAPPRFETAVSRARGAQACLSCERLPAWWDLKDVEEVVVVDRRSTVHNHSGEVHFFAAAKGLIYILDR